MQAEWGALAGRSRTIIIDVEVKCVWVKISHYLFYALNKKNQGRFNWNINTLAVNKLVLFFIHLRSFECVRSEVRILNNNSTYVY